MKKLINHLLTIFILITSVRIIPLRSMNKPTNLITFVSGEEKTSIERRNVPLMYTLRKNYQHYEKTNHAAGIKLFDNISIAELTLVNQALNISPDVFDTYYKKQLSSTEQNTLVKACGKYDEDGKKLKLFAPQLIKQLVDVYFPLEVAQLIKKYSGAKKKENHVIGFFKKQLIYNNASYANDISLRTSSTMDLLRRKVIYPGSLFLNGYHTNIQPSPIPLKINDLKCKTYASRFITNRYEYHITDIEDNQCSLWTIDHQNITNSSSTFKTIIQHDNPIMGCFFSNIGTNTEYAITYSTSNINISKISIENGKSHISATKFFFNDNNYHTIVDVCFNHDQTNLLIASHTYMSSVLSEYNLNNATYTERAPFNFKNYGLVEKICIDYNNDGRYVWLIFCAAGNYIPYTCFLNDNNQLFGKRYDALCVESLDKYNEHHVYNQLISAGPSIFFYSFSYTPIEKIKKEYELNNPQPFLANFIELFTNNKEEQLNKTIYHIYSPYGNYRTHINLKKKEGCYYVEITLKYAMTDTTIYTDNISHHNFAGVGFDIEETKLIICTHAFYNKIIPLPTEEDNKKLDTLQKIISNNFGVLSLFTKLCKRYKKKQTPLILTEDSPTYRMLQNLKNEPYNFGNFFEILTKLAK